MSGIEACLALPRPMVFTNGVFDLLHAGHVHCLEAARREGRSLVVGINSDASARRLGKGAGRPVHGQAQRARVVAALRCVDAVLLFDDDAPLALIEALRPQVYVKGGDYAQHELRESALVARWGGRTVIVERLPGLSSTATLLRAGHVGTRLAASSLGVDTGPLDADPDARAPRIGQDQ